MYLRTHRIESYIKIVPLCIDLEKKIFHFAATSEHFGALRGLATKLLSHYILAT